MSFSVFYAVRFSPAPELGEWLNVAVVGEAIDDHKAGVIVTDSLTRIEAAFGNEAVERVKALCADISSLVDAMKRAYERGEETQPIPMAMRDQALSLAFSEQIMVFEGSFEDALTDIAKKYLSGTEDEWDATHQVINQPKVPVDTNKEIARIAGALKDRFAKFSREALEQGQKAIENIVHTTEPATVLVVGGAGHLGSALLPKILDSGKKVRLLQSTPQGPKLYEIVKRSGIAGETVTDMLASDIATSMEGVNIVIFIPEGGPEHRSASKAESLAYARIAKLQGVKRFIIAGKGWAELAVAADWQSDLDVIGDDNFAITSVQLGELYGHAASTQWFGDLHDESGKLQAQTTVNVLTAQALSKGKLSVTDSKAKPYIHVEDAVRSILTVLDAPAEIVNGQIYSVGAENQVRTTGEIANLIKNQAPHTEVEVSGIEGNDACDQLGLSKIYDELGFSPVHTLEEGISQVITALQDGSVSKYVAATPADLEVRSSGTEIIWDNLTQKPSQTEPAADQSLKQRKG